MSALRDSNWIFDSQQD